jgi:hypothetical protein
MTEDTDEIEPQYQKGLTSVEHRNIDSAGEDHPFGDEAQSFEADLRHLIRKVADDLYESWQATFREYLANAETACLRVKNDDSDIIVSDSYQPKIEVEWNKQEDKVTIQDNGIGMAAPEVDEIFRQVGHSASRDDGSKSGQFGMGALSFVKLAGLDNAIIMTSHSRLNDDNAAYYVTLAGVEPIVGSLPDEQYGTMFQMTPKDDFPIRDAVEKYSEWMRVPVRYEEIGTDGTVEFQEDYGDKSLYDDYNENRLCLCAEKEDSFEVYSSPDAAARTLLLSMDIHRNDGKYQPSRTMPLTGQHGSPFPFDIRLLDESGKVIESSNGNEGLMPTPRSEYESMLVEARDPYISEDLLNNGDVLGQELESGDGIVVTDEVYEDIQNKDVRVAPNNYIPKSQISEEMRPGATRSIAGPNKGKILVSDERWDEMEEGRAELYVPEDELESYDVDTGEGDLCLPQPTSDRDRLQSHPTFWSYIGQLFAGQFDDKVEKVYKQIDESDDPLAAIMDMEPDDLVVSRVGQP